MKSMSGRGRERKERIQFVHDFLDEEFEKLSELGVKITSSLLMDIAKHSLTTPGSSVLPTDVDVSSRMA